MAADPKDLNTLYADCTLCPRRCHANRFERSGFCGAGTLPKIARAALHLWEEPCLGGPPEAEANADANAAPEEEAAGGTGGHGSGAVFFSHCTLRCVFCQNHEISAGGYGREISVQQLGETFLRLQAEGAANIDLVTPSHFLPSVIEALDLVRPRLKVPVVYNCGGYESVETVRLAADHVDIWLPDMKYSDDALALRYSGVPGYSGTALAAIGEMIRLAGPPVFDEQSGRLRKGVIVRHMVLPGHRQDSIRVLQRLAETFSPDSFLISLLSQYTPFLKAVSDPVFQSLNRRITSFEYDSVVKEALRLGMQGYCQEKSSAREEYTPSFDLEGVP